MINPCSATVFLVTYTGKVATQE